VSAETAPEPACRDCGAVLVGRYCHECGDDSRPARRDARALVEDALDNVFSFTRAALPTVRDLALHPARLLIALRDGDRRRYLSPFKLYATATVVFFLFLGLSGVTFFQLRVIRTEGPPSAVVSGGELVRMTGFRMDERFLHPRANAPRDAEVVAAVQAAELRVSDPIERAMIAFVRMAADDPSAMNARIATWAPRVLWVLMPLYALLLWPLFRRGALLVDHFIAALWAHASLFLLLILGALWNMTGLTHGLLLALLAYQGYLTAGLKGYYGGGWASTALKAGVHSVAYIGLCWLPLTAGFFIAEVMAHVPSSYWSD
jgi:hypothetical protein